MSLYAISPSTSFLTTSCFELCVKWLSNFNANEQCCFITCPTTVVGQRNQLDWMPDYVPLPEFKHYNISCVWVFACLRSSSSVSSSVLEPWWLLNDTRNWYWDGKRERRWTTAETVESSGWMDLSFCMLGRSVESEIISTKCNTEQATLIQSHKHKQSHNTLSQPVTGSGQVGRLGPHR